MPSDYDGEDAFWSLVLAAARLRAHPVSVEYRYEDRPRSMLEPYGIPMVRREDSATADVRLMTMDTHVIPARAAREEIGRILGHASGRQTPTLRELMAVPAATLSSSDMGIPTARTQTAVATVEDTIAALEAVARAGETRVIGLPSPAAPPSAVPTPPIPDPEGPPASGDDSSIRYSLMELD